MDYLLTEEQKMIKDLAHKIAEEKIRPLAAKYDVSEEYPWEVLKVMAESDMFGLFIPEEYGGLGTNVMNLCLATEEFSAPAEELLFAMQPLPWGLSYSIIR